MRGNGAFEKYHVSCLSITIGYARRDMDENDFLGPNPIIVNLQADNRWQAIDELVDALIGHGKIKPHARAAIIDAVKQRETAMTTGIGMGIAIPHASTDLVSEVVAVLGRSQKGIQFETLDGQLVHQVMLFLVPHGQFQLYQKTLANIAKWLHRQQH